jgi:hypothetical protein
MIKYKALTPRRYRLRVRTVPSQGTNPGSIPGIATKPSNEPISRWNLEHLREAFTVEKRLPSRAIRKLPRRIHTNTGRQKLADAAGVQTFRRRQSSVLAQSSLGKFLAQPSLT